MPHHALQRYVYLLAALVLSIVVLYFGRDLILLFVASGLLAFLLLPLARHVEAWGAPRWAGALMATVVLLLLVLGIFFLAGWQLARFGEDLPALQQAFASKGQALQVWIEEQAHISQREQLQWFNERLADLAGMGGSLLVKVFSGTGAVLAAVVPIPIIVFLLLVLKDKFRIFFERSGSTQEVHVLDILRNISSLSRKYLRGVMLVILILGTLSSIGFLLLDLKYAVLLGFTIGFLNVVPYVGAHRQPVAHPCRAGDEGLDDACRGCAGRVPHHAIPGEQPDHSKDRGEQCEREPAGERCRPDRLRTVVGCGRHGARHTHHRHVEDRVRLRTLFETLWFHPWRGGRLSGGTAHPDAA